METHSIADLYVMLSIFSQSAENDLDFFHSMHWTTLKSLFLDQNKSDFIESFEELTVKNPTGFSKDLNELIISEIMKDEVCSRNEALIIYARYRSMLE
jgi:hypothetical protein